MFLLNLKNLTNKDRELIKKQKLNLEKLKNNIINHWKGI